MKTDWRWITALIVCIALVVGAAVYVANRSVEPPAPAPTVPVVPVVPDQVPITPVSDAQGPKPGTVPDNGIAPADAQLPPPDPQQYVAPVDGFGGQVTFAKRITKTPWTPAQAVVYAAGQVAHPDKNYYALCAHSISWYYGFGGYGYASAKAGGRAVPKKLRHSAKNAGKIPAGAIVYFIGGDTGPWGHVVLSAGDGTVYSNDIITRGRISRVKLSLFKKKWGMSPSFWTDAYLPAAFGRNPNPAPKLTASAPRPAPKPKPVVDASVIATVCRRNARYDGVVPVRRALGIKGGNKCDTYFRRNYAKWQKKLGYRGRAADGIPGYLSLQQLSKKAGTFKAVR